MLQLTLLAQGLPNIENLVVFMSILLVWATLRPSMVRDYDNRRLPNNPTARLLFAFICLVIYVGLVAFLHKFGDVARRFSEALPGPVRSFIEANKEAAPLLAAMMLGTLLQLGFFRDLERSLLVWLHSARHLHGDTLQLANHLERCKFLPSDDERERNRGDARRFGIYLVDSGVEGVNLVTFHSWRKVASLLRLLRQWNGGEHRLLSPRDMDLIESIETAHERKTQLAMTIVKMIDKVERGGKTASALTDLLGMLTGTGHGDRAGVDAIETKLKQVLDGGGAMGSAAASQAGALSADLDAGRPLRLSSRQFEDHLQEIESYFKVEYDILLGQVAGLTAKSVVLSGDDAPERLEVLKGLGFQGLGRIEPINFDRILWMFLLVAGGGFLIMFLGNIGNPVPPSYDRLARFSIVMAIAALIGAMVGSHQRHARALWTPWTTYFAAGLAAALANVAISEMWELARSYMIENAIVTQQAQAQPAGAQPSMHVRTLIWSFLPALLTVAVCRLGRLETWPGLDRLPRGWGRSLVERTIDGFAVSGAVLIGYYFAIGSYGMFGWTLPPAITQLTEKWHILPIPVMMPLQIMGFFIGFFTLRDVRRAAQSSMIDKRVVGGQAAPARTSVPVTGRGETAAAARSEPPRAAREPAPPPGTPLPV